MKNKTMKQKNGKRFTWFGVLVTLLSFLLAGLVILAVYRSTPRKSEYVAEPSMILNALNNGRYADALTEVAENRGMGVDERSNSDYTAPYAACDYFEAYSYYLAYSRTGDTARAAEYEAEMQQHYEKMGNLQFMAEEMKKALK